MQAVSDDWRVYREAATGKIRADLTPFVPADAVILQTGYASRHAAAEAARDIEAAEEHRRAVEAGQMDLFGGGE